MSIVITIEDEHPDYLRLLGCLESPVKGEYGGHVMIEQHADGTWSSRFASVRLPPTSARYRVFLVQIQYVKR